MVGTVSQVGTRVFVGGTASGIDTAALIDAAVQQKTFRADRLDIEINENIAGNADTIATAIQVFCPMTWDSSDAIE